MAKLSIHRIMAELKLLDSRISNAISTATFVRANKNSNKKIDGYSIDDYKDKIIRASYNQIMDLIKRRQQLRRVLVLTNAGIDVADTDMVSKLKTYPIANENLTIVEIIDLEKVIDFKQALVNQMAYQLRLQKSKISQEQDKIEDDFNKSLTALGFKDKTGKLTTEDQASIDTLYAQFVSTRSYDLINPLDLDALITSMSNEINSTKAAIDATKSEANAMTTVELAD